MQRFDRSKAVPIRQWTVLTTIGLAGGLISGLLIGMPLGQLLNAMIVTAVVTSVVGGVLGSFQAVGLRRRLTRPVWWVVATIVGVGVGLALGVVLVEQTGIFLTGARPRLAQLGTAMRAISFVALGLVSGTVLGVAQWIVFRAQRANVEHWVLANGMGLAVAFCASSFVVELSGVHFASALGVSMFVVVAGVLFGAATGWPLRSAAYRS